MAAPHVTFLHALVHTIPSADSSEVQFRRGKVRDIYEVGDKLLIISTDRISAFDCVLPTAIPDKGRILNQLSAFWFKRLDFPNHLITADPDDDHIVLSPANRAVLNGRAMLVRNAEAILIECVVRGYLAGSAWAEYQKTSTVCGQKLPTGLTESAKLERPIFTPATKAANGHDENIPFDRMVNIVGSYRVTETLRQTSLALYLQAVTYAAERGIIIADTKFEFGYYRDQPILIDEVLTPDSSRLWPADQYQPGRGQPSFDKQYVRDWLIESGWDKKSPPPELPNEVVLRTRAKYIEAYERLTGSRFEP